MTGGTVAIIITAIICITLIALTVINTRARKK